MTETVTNETLEPGPLDERFEGAGVEGYYFRKLVAHASVAFDHTPPQIVGPNRMQGPTRVRHAIMWVLRELGWSYPTIARQFGVDHTTVIHGNKRFQTALDNDEEWSRIMRQELLAPGTIKGITDTIDDMRESASSEIRTQRVLTQQEQTIAELSNENEGLRIKVQALLKTIEDIGRERDMYFDQKQDMGARYNEKRNRLVAIQTHARRITGHDHPTDEDLEEVEYGSIIDKYYALVEDILQE